MHRLFLDSKKAYASLRREVLCNFWGVWCPHKTGKANEMCMNETYSRVWVGKHLSDKFPIRNGLKQGDAL